MSRPLRVQFPGACYHITARGNGGAPIFVDDRDRAAFVENIELVVGRYGVECLAYCLLDNHVHLVFQTPRANLAPAMHRLSSVYALAFNRRHRRVGHVFQGRYHAVVVERDPHLLEVLRYVALNPVRAGLCAAPEQWLWSSYRATAGLEPAPTFLRVGIVLGLFGADSRSALMRYREFVEAGTAQNPFARMESPLFLSSAWFAQEHTTGVRARGVPRSHWQPARPSLEELVRVHAGDTAIAIAHREYGYTLQAIADVLGVHPATAGRRLRRTEAERGA